ncbi:phosphotransferase enzyme family protein [Histoplasma capsulatum var. duboisii H88]|uniref:Phosphotransferase enzyme family protein n=1 Tax=Ajellomyces capsulatus (strain H88) TaxID=544711 RepID=F0UTQ5_AJEC8|nr:phosphotransferase enzyme family protein [Histoplasma capsulatum var. duboisii H88]
MAEPRRCSLSGQHKRQLWMLAKALACDPAQQRGEMREPVSSRGRRKLSRRYDGDESSPTQKVELAADQTETGADHPTTRAWWRMEHGNDDNDHDTDILSNAKVFLKSRHYRRTYIPSPVSVSRRPIPSRLLGLFCPAITYPPVHQRSARNCFEIHHADGCVSSASKKNGRETIVPIRTPIARPLYYTTVSEVAAMDFLRTVLKLPVPAVLAYSTSSVNPIGVECILMEAEIIAIGLSPVDCVTSPARREMVIIRRHSKPQLRQPFLLPTNYNIHPSERTSLLSHFPHLAPHLIPPDSRSVLTLRHLYLSPSNILLAPGSTKIISVLDWQDAAIFPRVLQVGYPPVYEHGSSQRRSLQIPSLSDDFDGMGIDQQRQCKAAFRLEEANLYYTAATGVRNEEHMNVLKLPHLGMWQYLFHQTGDEDREAVMVESREWNESEELLSRIREHLHIDPEGGTEPDNFERAVEGNRQFHLEMVRQTGAGQ